eukprot:TRINITY_DN190645_c0_g1_i1.p1 TRINITY_DN190645_c0_g1~~TRINITY_DN190645_c0_g1_i1.p1  ORF type:complete len:118 (+),score=5.94 TRINITY_DN190645_c0_g1_i1:138-491(+)
MLKTASLYIKPLARKDVPSTKRRFERIEPSSVPLTTSNRPNRKDWTVKINSTALPKVAFTKPPTTSPVEAESSSVNRPKSAASGINAIKLVMNTAEALQFLYAAQYPRGRNTSKIKI